MTNLVLIGLNELELMNKWNKVLKYYSTKNQPISAEQTYLSLVAVVEQPHEPSSGPQLENSPPEQTYLLQLTFFVEVVAKSAPPPITFFR
ncbi:hypothetical protein LX99_00802 [Mucilaginibacter oryzae]|uniref:Uncharacterized protein n=1 Tax=Mucilaginibacter oryzae TaxID=468058 RepID=A0A316HJ65_9SPHI|nr:hypothetical protein [Mucilaginibacter oryzae]PWK80337.1 hypothetical protein LX99_00802 [Mucilaginibacter oryzae]